MRGCSEGESLGRRCSELGEGVVEGGGAHNDLEVQGGSVEGDLRGEGGFIRGQGAGGGDGGFGERDGEWRASG